MVPCSSAFKAEIFKFNPGSNWPFVDLVVDLVQFEFCSLYTQELYFFTPSTFFELSEKAQFVFVGTVTVL